ncbi:MAG: archease [Candidatus Eisenbacteria bacterium]
MAVRPVYTEIEHTADVGIELTAVDLASALSTAAAAMFDMMCGLDLVAEDWRTTLTVDAREGDLENLLVRWLSELLFLHHSEGVLLSRFEVVSLGGGSLTANVAGERIDAARHPAGLEIKAATYHDLLIDESTDGWRVRVIFDT